MTKETIEALVDGGNANPGPPLGPALGPLGVNTAEVVKEINEKTKGFAGMKIPVKVNVDTETKQFDIVVVSPPTAALLKKEIGIEKGSTDGNPAGDCSFQLIMKVADMKMGSILANDKKAAIKEVVGSCQSLNVTIEGRTPKEITAEIEKGLLDDFMAGKSTVMPDIVIKKEQEVKIVGQEEEKPLEEEVAEEDKEAGEEDKEGDKEEESSDKSKKSLDRPKK